MWSCATEFTETYYSCNKNKQNQTRYRNQTFLLSCTVLRIKSIIMCVAIIASCIPPSSWRECVCPRADCADVPAVLWERPVGREGWWQYRGWTVHAWRVRWTCPTRCRRFPHEPTANAPRELERTRCISSSSSSTTQHTRYTEHLNVQDIVHRIKLYDGILNIPRDLSLARVSDFCYSFPTSVFSQGRSFGFQSTWLC